MPDDPRDPDSLGDDRTVSSGRDAPPESEQSLGDAGTDAGGFDSSISDLEFDGHAAVTDLPLIDLAVRYEIEGELGKGGMGAVQLATDRQLKRKVAIKRILASSPSALKRFVTEAQSIAALNHFNIVQIHDFGRDAEGPLLVLEYVSGGSLLDRLKDDKLDVEDAISITSQLCDALTVAHQKEIIHRDIKPANILLTEEGIPKLTDFGLAVQKEVDDRNTKSGIGMGTLYYMAPEQRRDASAADARSDLWSLAATLYKMITGKTPDVIRLDQLPANLAPVIGTMLEEDPEERYQDAGEFKSELRKGMSLVAVTLSPDLAAGVCPSCDTANDASRKFCYRCAESLVVPCLSCSQEIAVWHNICGQCGCKQDEQRDLIREKLEGVIEESLTLARSHEYGKALSRLKIVVNELKHTFTEEIREQAAEQIKLVSGQRDEQHQLRDQVVELANQHQQEQDYGAVVRELETIPAPLRTGNAIADQLLAAKAAQEQQDLVREELVAIIEDSLTLARGHEYEKALVQLRKVQDDQHVFIEEIREQAAEQVTLVTVQRDKQYQLRDHVVKKAEILVASCDYEAAIRGLKSIPFSLHTVAIVTQLSKIELTRDELLSLQKQISGDIKNKRTHGLLEKTTRFLQLSPGHPEVQKLHDQLQQRQQTEASKLQYEQAEKKRRILEWVMFVSGALALALILAVSVIAAVLMAFVTVFAILMWTSLKKKTLERSVTLQGHSNSVTSVAFSPDGMRIVSGSDDKTLRVWDAEKVATLKGHSDGVKCVAFSPDGKQIVSGSRDKTLKVWDVDSGQPAFTLKGHAASVRSVSFSPDGKRIVSGSFDKTVKVWDAKTGQEMLTLEGHSDGVNCVAFSPDGKRIVSASRDKTLKVWDVDSGQELLILKGHSSYVMSVSFSPDGKRIVSGSFDNTLKVWDAETGQLALTLKGHSEYVRSVSFSPDGRRIVSGSNDGTLKVWDIETGRETLTIKGHSDLIMSAEISPNGKWIVSGSVDGMVKVWDLPGRITPLPP